MSRKADLEAIAKQISDQEGVIKSINTSASDYGRDVQATVEQILRDAGVYEEVHTLETERVDFMKKAQDKLNKAQQELQRLQGIQAFLIGRQKLEERRNGVVEGSPEVDSHSEEASPSDVEPAKRPRLVPPSI